MINTAFSNAGRLYLADVRKLRFLIVTILICMMSAPSAFAEGRVIRVLFVGGDWKSQLPNYKGKTPLRGYFVKEAVEKALPGRFEFTLWTSYEFLQYGDSESLKNWDVLVVGDLMGQSVLPRLERGVREFVEGGGGLWYADNHKAFQFTTKELSFDAVLPIETVPFRAYGPEPRQPRTAEGPVKVQVVADGHPIMKGLDFSSAPALRGTDKSGPAYGTVKPGATVIARSPQGKDIWVTWPKGKGRVFWSGGVFANDELSQDFAEWPQFGRFYAQALSWLAEGSSYKRTTLENVTATGTLVIDPGRKRPALSAKHFGVHGQEDAPGGSHPMTDADLELYQALRLEGTFARTSAFTGIKRGKDNKFMDDGADLTVFDPAKYDWTNADVVRKDIERIKAEPIFLYWCPWRGPDWPDPSRYTKYFAASLDHLKKTPGPQLEYFEIMNEPNLAPVPEVLERYARFYNSAVEALRPRDPAVRFGCGGFHEWPYVQAIIDRCGKNLDWFSRHPYGLTGEAVFYLHDRFAEHARERGNPELKFIITEWDFWIYGEPAFDYIMMRWKPLADRADSCLGSLHYRWREYHEGGYVFGLHGEFDRSYGELPPDWPNPGKDKPITYRYNAFRIMRDCRGPQLESRLEVPGLRGAVAGTAEDYAARCASPTDLSTRAYALATCDGNQFNVTIYYGYAHENPAKGESYEKLKIRILSPVPSEVKGRSLVISRANCRTISEETPVPLHGDKLDVTVEIPARSGISLTVK